MDNKLGDKFSGTGDTIITPDCFDCIYAIDNGVEGCEIDEQTYKIECGEEHCNKYKKK